MSYEFYKLLHLAMIIIFVSGVGISFYSPAKIKLWSILTGITSVLILVSGMGLLARLGISHGEPFPTWVLIKFAVWFLIGAGAPIVLKRFPQFKPKGFFVVLALVLIAVAAVILKF